MNDSDRIASYRARSAFSLLHVEIEAAIRKAFQEGVGLGAIREVCAEEVREFAAFCDAFPSLREAKE